MFLPIKLPCCEVLLLADLLFVERHYNRVLQSKYRTNLDHSGLCVYGCVLLEKSHLCL